MSDYAKNSFWLQTSGDDLTPRPPLRQSIDVDVAILGGGYTGLWTAYYLLCGDPGLNVAIVEKEIVGFGASGRNGGWCSSKFPVSPTMLEERYGREKARSLLLAMNDTVAEVSRVCQREGIDAHFHKGGILTLSHFTGSLYGGVLNLAGTVDGSQSALAYDIHGQADGLPVGDMLRTTSGSNVFGSVINVTIDGRLNASDIVVRGRGAIPRSVHALQHLRQAPAFTPITFGLQNAFAFEVHIIDQRVAPVRCARDALELPLDIVALRRRGLVEHFGQRLL